MQKAVFSQRGSDIILIILFHFFSKVITKKRGGGGGGYSDKKNIRVSCFRMMSPYMKFQNSQFHGSKVTKRHRTRDTYIQTYTSSLHPPTHTSKAVCPSSFFKVQSETKQGDSILLGAIRERIRALGPLSNNMNVLYLLMHPGRFRF